MSAWRYARAIVLCPGVVTILVPIVLVWWTGDVEVGWGLPKGFAALPVLLGATLIGIGIGLVAGTVRLFATSARGRSRPGTRPRVSSYATGAAPACSAAP